MSSPRIFPGVLSGVSQYLINEHVSKQIQRPSAIQFLPFCQKVAHHPQLIVAFENLENLRNNWHYEPLKLPAGVKLLSSTAQENDLVFLPKTFQGLVSPLKSLKQLHGGKKFVVGPLKACDVFGCYVRLCHKLYFAKCWASVARNCRLTHPRLRRKAPAHFAGASFFSRQRHPRTWCPG